MRSYQADLKAGREHIGRLYKLRDGVAELVEVKLVEHYPYARLRYITSPIARYIGRSVWTVWAKEDFSRRALPGGNPPEPDRTKKGRKAR